MADAVICYGGAQPGDTYLLADVVAIDSDILAWLEQRQRKQGRSKNQ
jgi:hypothetical protein